MKPNAESSYIAFAGGKKIASGEALETAKKIKTYLEKNRSSQILIFDAVSSGQIEIDFRGSQETVLKRLKDSFRASDAGEAKVGGPGRPKLGVISREIGLLPRHWEWLATQPGGASSTLRKLVDDAKKRTQHQDGVRQAQEVTYKFISVMAGDLEHYEEALRALYAKKESLFETLTAKWPKDIRDHALKLAEAVFAQK